MKPPFDVTLVTYDAVPDLSPDDQLLRTALERAGLRVRSAVWTDAAVDWHASRLTVIRSTWDYFHQEALFRQWIECVGGHTRLVNTPDVLAWNIDKGYLETLRRSGIPVVPTRYLQTSEPTALDEALDSLDSIDIVIKPTVGGASFGAARFDLSRERPAARDHARALLQSRRIMIQPYLRAVETERERSLVYIDGRFSHAFHKAPFSDTSVGEAASRRHPASAEEQEFGSAVLHATRMPLAYARVDLVPGDKGPLLMELELIEPALLFECGPGSAERFADHLVELTADERRQQASRPVAAN